MTNWQWDLFMIVFTNLCLASALAWARKIPEREIPRLLVVLAYLLLNILLAIIRSH